jgi:hypothetical protein
MSGLMVAMVREGLIVRPSRGRYAATPADLKVWEATRGVPERGTPPTGHERSHAEQLRLSMPHPTYSRSGMHVSCGENGKIIPLELARWQGLMASLTKAANGEGSPAPGVGE